MATHGCAVGGPTRPTGSLTSRALPKTPQLKFPCKLCSITIGPLKLRRAKNDRKKVSTNSYFLANAGERLEVGRAQSFFSHAAPSPEPLESENSIMFIQTGWLRHPNTGTFTAHSGLPIVLMDDHPSHYKDDADTNDGFTSSLWAVENVEPVPVSSKQMHWRTEIVERLVL